MADDQDIELEGHEDLELQGEEGNEEYEPQGDQSFMDKYKSVIFLGILGVLFVIFGIYQLMSLFGDTSSTAASAPGPVKKQVITKSAPSPATPVVSTPVNPTPPPILTPPVVIPSPAAVTAPVASAPTTMPAVNPAALPSEVSVPAVPPAAPKPTPVAVQPEPIAPPQATEPKMDKAAVVTKAQPSSKTAVAPTTTPNSTDVSTIQNRLGELEKSMKNQKQAAETASKPEDLQAIQVQLQDINQELDSIKAMLKKQPKQVRTVWVKPKAARKHPALAKMPPIPPVPPMPIEAEMGYYVKAVVPGRAWLQGSGDQTITVTVGDELPGYGKVMKIDAEQGMVATQSGKVIPFGINAQ